MTLTPTTLMHTVYIYDVISKTVNSFVARDFIHTPNRGSAIDMKICCAQNILAINLLRLVFQDVINLTVYNIACEKEVYVMDYAALINASSTNKRGTTRARR